MTKPVLDNRTKKDIRETVKKLAAQYLPQWRTDGASSDPAAALTELFCEMFAQTVDRFNAVPDKLYTEFLNLLGVTAPAATAATGIVRFAVHNQITETIRVPEKTRLFVKGKGADTVVYETETPVDVTPAVLQSVFYADSAEGVIRKLDPQSTMRFFTASGGENLQKHVLEIESSEVLTMDSSGTVEIAVDCGNERSTAGLVQKLTDPSYASWFYRSGDSWELFPAPSAGKGCVCLKKEGTLPMRAVKVVMKQMKGRIAVDRIRLSSTSADPVAVREMLYEDMPIDPEEGGYCYGKIFAPYDSFYLRHDMVFSRRGATVHLELDLSFIQRTEVDTTARYSFDKSIIDKNEAVVLKTDNVYVSKVIWEYYNGKNWKQLFVTGNSNPFSGQGTAEAELTFVVPEDVRPAELSFGEGYYIRARIADIENQYSMLPNYILPYVRGVSASWDYTMGRAPHRLAAYNNGEVHVLDAVEDISAYRMVIYDEMPGDTRAMYLRFSESFHGRPVSLLFEINGRITSGQSIRYEIWDGTGFREVFAEDGTDHFRHSGIVNLYVPEEVPRTAFFSEEGYWMRITPLGSGAETGTPVVTGITPNCVRCLQQEHSGELFYSAEVEEQDKIIQLPYTHVILAEVWIDEIGAILDTEIEALLSDHPEDIRLAYEDGVMTSCLVRWKETSAIRAAEPEDRMFELDHVSGKLLFGNGKAGKVPPSGTDNIHIRVSYGGGEKGNIGAGLLNGFQAPIPKIVECTNVTPMAGGVGEVPRERVEAYGNRILRHRGRAVSIGDFEDLVMQEFAQIEQVRCFGNMDAEGAKAPGHVCVVVKSMAGGSESLNWETAGKIREFLSARCDCCLVSSGRLHVKPAIDMKVNVDVTVIAEDPGRIVQIQTETEGTIRSVITDLWSKRRIGDQIRVSELLSAVSKVNGVTGVPRLLAEGVYYKEGLRYVIPLEKDEANPFVTVTSGIHKVRISSC